VLAIACNAVIDGLWLEGAAPCLHLFGEDELARIAVQSIGADSGL
jgi:TetR/AcrR family transcriptional regulator, transcriptional repressor of bet genes